MDVGGDHDSCNDDLLLCCVCSSTLDDAMQLECLHNCCRRCLSMSAAALDGGHGEMSCPQCQHVSRVAAVRRNDFLDNRVRRRRLVAKAATKCGACADNGDPDRPATEWCASCQRSLCEDCLSGHAWFNSRHATTPLDDLERIDSSRGSNAPAAYTAAELCPSHKKPLDIVCLTCATTKCKACWPRCHAGGHQTHHRDDPSLWSHVARLREDVILMQGALLSRSSVLNRCRNLAKELKASRTVHLAELRNRKRRILDAVADPHVVAERAVKDMYDYLADRTAHLECAASELDRKIVHAVRYGRYVLASDSPQDLLSQQAQLLIRLRSLLADVDALSEPLSAPLHLSVDSTLPDNVEEVIDGWIGKPKLNADNHAPLAEKPQSGKADTWCTASSPPPRPSPRSLFFGSASRSTQATVPCCDVALTPSGHVLVAAHEHGLLEYGTSGRVLSTWRPPVHDDGEDDLVTAVELLSDGQVAVGVLRAQLVVLLRLSLAGDTWQESRRAIGLLSPPYHLAVCGDVAAVAEYRYDYQEQLWRPGRQLEVISIAAGEPAHAPWKQTREYCVWSVAITSRAVFTTSRDTVLMGDGGCHRRADVVEAYCHRGKQLLWRYAAADGERLLDVCSAAAGKLLYVAACSRRGAYGSSVTSYSNGSVGGGSSFDAADGYVATISTEDGRTLDDAVTIGGGDVALHMKQLSRPERMAVAGTGPWTVLAVLGGHYRRTLTIFPGRH